jgi:PhnB protein
MPSRLNPYLGFNGNAREALDFYRSVFGGELTVTNFAEGGMPHDPADANKIMHGQLISPSGYWLMASDNPSGMPFNAGTNITVSLSGDARDELQDYWEKLLSGGSVTVPLEQAPWGDSFGMLTDKFGIAWMVNIAGAAG